MKHIKSKSSLSPIPSQKKIKVQPLNHIYQADQIRKIPSPTQKIPPPKFLLQPNVVNGGKILKVPPGQYSDWRGHIPYPPSQLQIMNLDELTFANEKTQSNMDGTGSISNPVDLEGIQINTNYAGSKAL